MCIIMSLSRNLQGAMTEKVYWTQLSVTIHTVIPGP